VRKVEDVAGICGKMDAHHFGGLKIGGNGPYPLPSRVHHLKSGYPAAMAAPEKDRGMDGARVPWVGVVQTRMTARGDAVEAR
jgi:hypothetical protein